MSAIPDMIFFGFFLLFFVHAADKTPLIAHQKKRKKEKKEREKERCWQDSSHRTLKEESGQLDFAEADWRTIGCNW